VLFHDGTQKLAIACPKSADEIFGDAFVYFD
jgi:hypothetical protein